MASFKFHLHSAGNGAWHTWIEIHRIRGGRLTQQRQALRREDARMRIGGSRAHEQALRNLQIAESRSVCSSGVAVLVRHAVVHTYSWGQWADPARDRTRNTLVTAATRASEPAHAASMQNIAILLSSYTIACKAKKVTPP